MPKLSCPNCGKKVEKTIAGSLTQFVLGTPLCACENTPAKFAKAKRDISYCYRCSKKIGEESNSSLTAFLQNRDYCRCRRAAIAKKTNMFASSTQVTAQAAVAEAAFSKAKLQEELESARTLAGTYRLVDRLGEGGMSYVYLAEHTRLRKMVALKVMKADIAMKDKEELFRAEAKRLVSLNHPCLTAVFDFAMHKEHWPVIAMELVSGETLADVLLRLGPLSVEEALLVFKQVAEGLSYIHLKGLVHKDLKPGNIMLAKLSDDGGNSSKTAVKILDFGISQFRIYGDTSKPGSNRQSPLIVGSPSYMSPEEWNGQEITPRTDLYAFACSLYEVLTGSVPYQAETIDEIREQHLNTPYPGLTENKVNQVYPNELDLLLQRLLAKRPEERARSAQEVVLAIDSILAKLTSAGDSNLERFRPIRPGLTSAFASVLVRRVVAVVAIASFLLAASIMVFFWQNSKAKQSLSLSSSSSSTSLAIGAKANPKPRLVASPGSTIEAFMFPTDYSLGSLTNKKGSRYDLQGSVEIELAPNQGLSYNPSAVVVAKPLLLEKLDNLPIIAVRVASDTSDNQLAVSADFINKLAANSRLQQLDLWSVYLDRSAIAAICALPSLKTLSMTESVFADDIRSSWGKDLAQAKCLKNIEHLNIHYLLPTSSVIDALAQAKHLQGLALVDSPLNAGSIAKIVAMKNLTSLELNNCAVTPKAALAFFTIPTLQKLALGPECIIDSEFLDRALKKRNLVNLFVGPIAQSISGERLRQYKTSFNDKQIFFRCQATPSSR